MTLVIQVALAAVAALAFSILFSAPRSQWLFCSLTGAISWLVNGLLIGAGTGAIVASFFATLTLTFFSRLLSHWRRTPATLFLTAGIFPLVPGAGIYYTAYYLFSSELSLGLSKGIETFEFAGAIALGILFGFSLPVPTFSFGKKKP